MPCERLVALLLLACAALSPLGAEDGPWIQDTSRVFTPGLQEKPAVLLFTSPTCQWCTTLKNDTRTHAELRAVISRTEAVEMLSTERPELMQAFGITGYPTLVLLNRRREVVRTIRGYLPPESLTLAVRTLLEQGDQQQGTTTAKANVAEAGLGFLIGSLGRGDATARASIREQLGAMPAAREALWAALDSPVASTRVDAAAALAKHIGAPTTYDPFASAAERQTAIAAWKAADQSTGKSTP